MACIGSGRTTDPPFIRSAFPELLGKMKFSELTAPAIAPDVGPSRRFPRELRVNNKQAEKGPGEFPPALVRCDLAKRPLQRPQKIQQVLHLRLIQHPELADHSIRFRLRTGVS